MAKRTCDPTINSIGSQTYWLGRNGQIVRARTVPSNPSTDPQVAQRQILTRISQAWDALTEAKRSAWRAAAANVQSRATLGMSGPLTGIQLFIKLNATLATFGQEQIDQPTAVPQMPDLAPTSLVITNTGGVIAIKLTCPSDPGENTIIWSEKPTKAGRFSAPELVIIGTSPAPVAGSADITAEYVAKFGVPAVGSRLFVAANQFMDGWQSALRTFTALVPASA